MIYYFYLFLSFLSKILLLRLKQSLHLLNDFVLLFQFLFIIENLQCPILLNRVHLLLFFQSHGGQSLMSRTRHFIPRTFIILYQLTRNPYFPPSRNPLTLLNIVRISLSLSFKQLGSVIHLSLHAFNKKHYPQ